MHDAYRHVVVFFFYRDGDHRDLHSFPTRRSSDLEALEQRFLRQSGFRLLLSRYHDLYDEGLIGKEVFEDLERQHEAARLGMAELPPLDLGLRAEELIGQFEMFAGLGAVELTELARLFRPRLLVPDQGT